MVRRAMPQLVAYDVCGVQPMSGPTGLIFALKARLLSDGGTSQQWTSELDQVSGADGDATGDLVKTPGLLIQADGTGETGTEYTSHVAQAMATGEGVTPTQMSFSIEKVSVAAGTRALAGSYSMELAQDLRAVHGLDAEAEPVSYTHLRAHET